MSRDIKLEGLGIEICPMCGANAEATVEIEPGLEPVCDDCALEYAGDHEEVIAPLVGEGEEPSELVDPGARNHPKDCECAKCEDRGPVKESTIGFDRFMDRILIQETKQGLKVLNDSPLRANAHRYQERPMGRVRMGVKLCQKELSV